MEARPAALCPGFIPLLDGVAAGARVPDGVEPPPPAGAARLCLMPLPMAESPRDGGAVATLRREPVRSLHRLEKLRLDLPDERKTSGAEFAAMVAHELGAPIAAIRYLSEMLMVGGLPRAEQTQALTAICQETDVLQTLVADLESAVMAERNDFSVRPHPVVISTLVAEPITFAATLPGEHPLTTRVDGEQRVFADSQRIGQVLRNLLENAAEYSPPGAPVELRARMGRHRMRIEVTDRGPGVPPGDRRRIFGKFERGQAGRNSGGHGLGLGLYLSRRLVQLHGSDLTVEARPGGGSIFGFDLEAVS